MTAKTKASAKPADDKPAQSVSETDATRIDMNDPTLTDAEAVARNLGLAETAAEADKA